MTKNLKLYLVLFLALTALSYGQNITVTDLTTRDDLVVGDDATVSGTLLLPGSNPATIGTVGEDHTVSFADGATFVWDSSEGTWTVSGFDMTIDGDLDIGGVIKGAVELEFSSVTAMLNYDFSSVSDGARVKCNGYHTAGDQFFGPDVFWDADSTATADGFSVFDPVVSGAGRLVRSFEGVVNILWGGAVGDGATDNDDIFQAVFDYFSDNSINGEILVPVGDFLIQSGLISTRPVRITGVKGRGNSPNISKLLTTTNSIDLITFQSIQGFHLRDLFIQSTATTPGDGIVAETASNEDSITGAVIERCTFAGFNRSLVMTACTGSKIRDCYFATPKNLSIYIDQTYSPDTGDNLITGNTFDTSRSFIGDAQAGGASSITLDATDSAVDDYYNGFMIYISSGTGVGQSNYITDYNGTTKVATVSAWGVAPDATSRYYVGSQACIWQVRSGGIRITENKFLNHIYPYRLNIEDSSTDTSIGIIQGNSFENFKHSAINLTATGTSLWRYWIISDNQFTMQGTSRAIIVQTDQVGYSIFSDNSMHGAGNSTGTVALLGATDWTISNNLFESSTEAIYMDSLSSGNVVTTDNVFYNVTRTVDNDGDNVVTTNEQTINTELLKEGDFQTNPRQDLFYLDTFEANANDAFGAAIVTITTHGLQQLDGVGIVTTVYQMYHNSSTYGVAELSQDALGNGLLVHGYHINKGRAQAGGASTITLTSNASDLDDYYNGYEIEIWNGTGFGQTETVLDYNGTTKVLTIDTTWGVTPDNTSDYLIQGLGTFSFDCTSQAASTSTSYFNTIVEVVGSSEITLTEL